MGSGALSFEEGEGTSESIDGCIARGVFGRMFKRAALSFSSMGT